MAVKPTTAYNLLRLYYIILYYIIGLLQVSATLLVILREMHYAGYITKLFELMHQRY